MRIDFRRLPKGTHSMVRNYYRDGYQLTRPDSANALKLMRAKKPNQTVYIVKAGPFVGLSFLRKPVPIDN